MGYSIVKQPNGLYARYCSYNDDLSFMNVTKEEYAERVAKEAYEETLAELTGVFADETSTRFKQMSMPWERAIELVENYHPKKAAKIRKECQ